MGKRNVYSSVEKSFIIEMVHRNKSIIENKKTDGATVQEKNACWGRITKEFNDVPQHSVRTTAQLKKLWDNLKTERKKELAAHKRQLMLTGDGPPPKKLVDDPSDVLLITFATEIDSSIDSDTVTPSVGKECLPVDQEDGETMEESDRGGKTDPISATPQEIVPDLPTPRQPCRSRQLQRGPSGREGLTTEARERVKRVKAQIAHDQRLHSLIIEEQKHLVTLAKLKVETQRKVLALAARKLNAEEENLTSEPHASEE